MQNWVWANCAPDLILPRSAFGCQPAGGSIGMSAPPIKNAAWPETLRPVGSVPSSRSRRAVSISVDELTSNTGLVSGWSPAFGSSPVRRRRLRTPSAAAPIISLCSAIRFLSRQVICRIGSIPLPVGVGGGAGAVGHVHRVGETLQRCRLAAQVLWVGRHRRGDFRGDDEPAGPHPLFERAQAGACVVVHRHVSVGSAKKRERIYALPAHCNCAVPGQESTVPLESCGK